MKHSDDPRFLPYASNLHQQKFITNAAIFKVADSGFIGKEDLVGKQGDQIVKRRNSYHLPYAQYVDAVKMKNMFTRDKERHLDAAANDLTNEPKPHKQFRFRAYCHVMVDAGKYRVSEKELRSFCKNSKAKQKRKLDIALSIILSPLWIYELLTL